MTRWCGRHTMVVERMRLPTEETPGLLVWHAAVLKAVRIQSMFGVLDMIGPMT
jgi:hypothetical protein